MRNIVTWILSVLVALVFLASGLAKLSGQSMPVAMFAAFGYPVWFMYLTGLLEVAGAMLILVPRFAFIGAGLLSCVMVGALVSHLSHGQASMIGAPLVLLVLAIVVGTLRGWGRGTGLTLSKAA